eukprot:CAMPEP_0201107368 /NCGR_PEP_ID=MMETSP0812-20130820/56198_1 /ASSEMBLY_ACC=CAM_ASM_000668 /TAXON_ID=98059 /ORGANISM="Dinobryon sp., Strain UTEXLB2267" /LENGTH=70 /DNA_ID=CAMNT_0047368191 /DNA_START=47 /DNA_END=256 /DNA_ORIENTATION=+
MLCDCAARCTDEPINLKPEDEKESPLSSESRAARAGNSLWGCSKGCGLWLLCEDCRCRWLEELDVTGEEE